MAQRNASRSSAERETRGSASRCASRARAARVVIGSRKLGARASRRRSRCAKQVPQARAVEGRENADAVVARRIVILSVPFEHTAGTLKAMRERLAPGQIVVSMGVPLATAIGDGAVRTLGVWQGSCAELVAALVPEGVHVVSAFQNVSAHRLQRLDEPVECDVVVSGAKEPRARVMELCALVPGLRAVDGGPLANARIVESITALLIGLNIRYQVAEGIGIRFTGLPACLRPALARRVDRRLRSFADCERASAPRPARSSVEQCVTARRQILYAQSLVPPSPSATTFCGFPLTPATPRSTQAARG